MSKEEKRPTFFSPDSVLGKSVSMWYLNSRSETKTSTFNIKSQKNEWTQRNKWNPVDLKLRKKPDIKVDTRMLTLGLGATNRDLPF